jgi:hypothetical protein
MHRYRLPFGGPAPADCGQLLLSKSAWCRVPCTGCLDVKSRRRLQFPAGSRKTAIRIAEIRLGESMLSYLVGNFANSVHLISERGCQITQFSSHPTSRGSDSDMHRFHYLTTKTNPTSARRKNLTRASLVCYVTKSKCALLYLHPIFCRHLYTNLSQKLHLAKLYSSALLLRNRRH